MARKSIPPTIQADVVIKSRRRCALCVFLDQNEAERPGQIAHLNGDHADSRFENLVWLCLEHHDKFDSKTSQTKNYTQIEVKNYRDMLYNSYVNSEYSQDDVALVQAYLRKYSGLFSYIFDEDSELAYKIHENIFDQAELIRSYWHIENLRSFNASIRELQDHIANNIVGILSVYDIDKYDLVGGYIRYDLHRFGEQILDAKKMQVHTIVTSISNYHANLEKIAML